VGPWWMIWSNPAFLKHCAQAQAVTVGKRGGLRLLPQELIKPPDAALRPARAAGLVRLKGG